MFVRSAVIILRCKIQDIFAELGPIEIHWSNTCGRKNTGIICDECARRAKQPISGKHLRFHIEQDRHGVVMLGQEWLHVSRAALVNGRSLIVFVFRCAFDTQLDFYINRMPPSVLSLPTWLLQWSGP